MEPREGPYQVGSDGRQAQRVLVVGHYASERTGGAGSIPLRLFGRLRARGVEAWLLTHVSSRGELRELLSAAEFERVIFAPSLRGFGPIFTWGERLPTGLRTIAWGITQLERQVAMVPAIRRLVRELAIDVVHQPISVSPVTPSPLRRLGAPVVMGPLNGGMELPPAFADRDSSLYALTKAARPVVAAVMNQIMRGRPEADVVLVANDRTRSLLPKSVRKSAIEISDIGVVLTSWPAPDEPSAAADTAAPDTATQGSAARFLFVGRLVGWKGVDILLDAFALVRERIPVSLEIVGDGPERSALAEQAVRIGCEAGVSFRGWLEPADCAVRMRTCDVYVSPSLQESGGIAVLEAMACARPVIAAAWGGHLSSVDETVGVLVDVSSRSSMVQALADAMVRLAGDPGLRSRLGAAGRRRVSERYDWDVLVDRTLRIYAEARTARAGRRQAGSARHELPDPRSAPIFTSPDRREFLDIRVDALTVNGLFGAAATAVADHQRVVIANHNLHSLYLHRRSPAMRQYFDQADYVHADGMWIVHLARLFKQPLGREHRITSLDWLGPFLEMADRLAWRVFFLGGTTSVAERFELYIRANYSTLSTGHHDGYFDARPDSAGNQEVLAAIRTFAPQVLIVCMGMPRQEQWIHANRSQLAANVIFPLGGIMDYLVGETATPPRWTGPLGVEWAYRLLHDPRRLAGRYIGEPIRLAPWIAFRFFAGSRSRGPRAEADGAKAPGTAQPMYPNGVVPMSEQTDPYEDNPA